MPRFKAHADYSYKKFFLCDLMFSHNTSVTE